MKEGWHICYCHTSQIKLISITIYEDPLELHRCYWGWEVSLRDEIQDVKPQIQLDQFWNVYFQVSTALSIRSLVVMTGLIILLVYVVVLCYFPKRTPRYDGLYWVSCHLLWCHLLWLNLWLSVAIDNFQSHDSMYQLN